MDEALPTANTWEGAVRLDPKGFKWTRNAPGGRMMDRKSKEGEMIKWILVSQKREKAAVVEYCLDLGFSLFNGCG